MRSKRSSARERGDRSGGLPGGRQRRGCPGASQAGSGAEAAAAAVAASPLAAGRGAGSRPSPRRPGQPRPLPAAPGAAGAAGDCLPLVAVRRRPAGTAETCGCGEKGVSAGCPRREPQPPGVSLTARRRWRAATQSCPGVLGSPRGKRPVRLQGGRQRHFQSSPVPLALLLPSPGWEKGGRPRKQECRYLHGEFQGPACGRDGPYTPDVFFWCCILFFATFALSSFLKKFKTSRYFPTRVRSTVSDFAVFLTIVIMVLLDFVVGIPSPKLHVPHAFKPTRDDRGWFINPIGPNPWWTVLAALIPALLCTILIFMDQQISAVIVNRKEHKLKKGCGYHLDLFVVAVMLGVCSVMGLPWFVAATVLSITHVNRLKVESDCSAPGEQPKFLGIREQRVTGLLIFVLMGCSVFFTSVLKFIPMPVLYGVFLYMGVSSLRGIQFFDRLKLFWMPAKHQPDFIYLRHVPLRKVHFFTAIQLICLVLLWTIKVSRAAIIFPLMVLALVFVRKAMDFCFSKRELSFLDDLMPERKKKLDDGRNEAGEEGEESQKALEAAAAASSVQLSVGKTSDLDIAKQRSDRTDPSEIIILDEMSQTPVWKALTLKTETL
ncbi:electroneutral sodium bicarbonate exchanger 1-like [Harpia harpyja]|uniref:electroneutral sodium bicarbonate exchanger 1-like n=1 Tax=Harpia harpyja TaxID=202280 RepID=UPI0022B0CA7E|nr:electroneutral sodium bicarbonate exchanger 1-like [Harpia harpyja]